MSDIRPHPAKFSKPILEKLESLTLGLPDGARVLDPFAGVGGIHSLSRFETVGVELEPEWAKAHDRTLVGDSRYLETMFDFEMFDAIITSPGYASRMSDRYGGDPKGSKRVTYRLLCLEDIGFVIDQMHHVKTRRMKMGANHHLRVDSESIVVAYKP